MFIDALLRRMEHDASFFVDAVHCARLAPAARAVVGQVLAAAAHPQLLFAIVCANMRLVHLVRPKRFVLQPLGLFLRSFALTFDESLFVCELSCCC